MPKMALTLTEEMQTELLQEDGAGGCEVVTGGFGVVLSVQVQTAQFT